MLWGGKAMLPSFAPGDASYPDGLDSVTPEAYRKHKKNGQHLNREQIAALEQMKQHTDSNDVASRSVPGRRG